MMTGGWFASVLFNRPFVRRRAPSEPGTWVSMSPPGRIHTVPWSWRRQWSAPISVSMSTTTPGIGPGKSFKM